MNKVLDAELVQPKYECKVHGDIEGGELIMALDGVPYGKVVCAKCYWDFLSEQLPEVIERIPEAKEKEDERTDDS